MSDTNVMVRIQADGSALKAELDDDLRALKAFANSANEANQTARNAVKDSIAAQREHQEAIRATTDQMRALNTIEEQFDERVQAVQTRSSIALNSAARGFSVLESSAHASVRSIDAISNAVAGLAFGFGPEGFLIGAVVMAGIAIERALGKADEATQKLTEDFVKLVSTTEKLPIALGGSKVLLGDVTELTRQLEAAQKELNAQLAVTNDFAAPDGTIVAGLKAQLKTATENVEKVQEHTRLLADQKGSAEGIKIMLEGQTRAQGEILRLTAEIERDRAAGLAGTVIVETVELDKQRAILDAQLASSKGMTTELREQILAEKAKLDAALAQLEIGKNVALERSVELERREQQLEVEKAIHKEIEAAFHIQEQNDKLWDKRHAEEKKNENIGGGFTVGSLDKDIAQEIRQVGEEMDRSAAKTRKLEEALAQMHTVGALGAGLLSAAFAELGNELEHGKFDGKKLLAAIGHMLVTQLQALAIADFAAALHYASSPETAALAGPKYAAAAKEEAGAIAIAALTGAIGGGGSGGGGAGSASAGTANGAANGAAGVGVPSNQTMYMQIVVVHKEPTGREIGKIRQALQRADDREQPLRVTI